MQSILSFCTSFYIKLWNCIRKVVRNSTVLKELSFAYYSRGLYMITKADVYRDDFLFKRPIYRCYTIFLRLFYCTQVTWKYCEQTVYANRWIRQSIKIVSIDGNQSINIGNQSTSVTFHRFLSITERKRKSNRWQSM